MAQGVKHEPTPETREAVAALVGAGASNRTVASVIGIQVRSLRSHYRQELKMGRDIANARVAQKLFKREMGGEIPAIIFWLRNRAPDLWPNTSRNQIAGPDDGPIQYEDAREKLHARLDGIAAALRVVDAGKGE